MNMSRLAVFMLCACASASASSATSASAAAASSSTGSTPFVALTRSERAVIRKQLHDSAKSGVNQLLTYYNPAQGQGWFGNSSQGFVPFWHNANAIETLALYMKLTNDMSPLPDIEDSFMQNSNRYCELGCYLDDIQWYVHAWLRVSEATGNITYLNTSSYVYSELLESWGLWNETCGGTNWEHIAKGGSYVNAIPNELFLSASGLLARMTGNDQPVTNYSYADWMGVEWNWLRNSPMLISQPSMPNAFGSVGFLLTDGLNNACNGINPTGAYWSYNQGVLLSGLAELAVASENATEAASIANLALNIAYTAFTYYNSTLNNTPNGVPNVIMERNCGANGGCGGPDGMLFKGIFIRHLAYALPTLVQFTPNPEAVLSTFGGLLLAQSSSILENNAVEVSSGFLQFGQLWQGPFAWVKAPWVTQSCALDAILSSMSVLDLMDSMNME